MTLSLQLPLIFYSEHSEDAVSLYRSAQKFLEDYLVHRDKETDLLMKVCPDIWRRFSLFSANRREDSVYL